MSESASKARLESVPTHRLSGHIRVHDIFNEKKVPSILFWAVSTWFGGAIVIAACLMMWTTISPFGKGAALMKEFQGDYADGTLSMVASFGMFVLGVLYFLDFFTAPHLSKKQVVSKVEEEVDMDDMEDAELHKNRGSVIDGIKRSSIVKTFRRKRDSVVRMQHNEAQLKKDQDQFLKDHNLTRESLSGFFNKDRYKTYLANCKEMKAPKFVIGNQEVSHFWTAMARSYFVMACLLVLSYGFVKTDEYPARPVLMTLLLYPVLIGLIRHAFRPPQHPSPNAVFELEVATAIMKQGSWNPEDHSYIDAKNHLSRVLSDKMIMETDKANFYLGCGISTAINCVGLIILYSLWTYHEPGYTWDDETKEMLYDKGITDEETAWAIWAGPAIVVMAYALMSGMFFIRYYVHEQYTFSDGAVREIGELINQATSTADKSLQRSKTSTGRVQQEQERDMERVIKLTFVGIVFIGMGFWLAAEAASCNPVVAHTVKQFLLTFMVFFGIFISSTMSRFSKSIKSKMGENFFLKMMVGALKSDWLKAFALLVFPYWIGFYALLSFLNQLVRKCRGVEDTRDYGSHEHEILIDTTWLTKSSRRAFKKFSAWNWTSIIGKAYVLGIVMFILNVVAEKCIYLLLIYVGETFDAIDMEPVGKAVLILFLWYLVGLVGFMLPPVPGPPLYLFGGVVVVRAFDNCGGEGFWIGTAIVVFTSLVLKLNACALQQKAIGEALGSQPWVRAACGVQTPFIRAVEMILKEKGLTMGKVAILCGGPDWPTSVLTGLLKCELKEMMLGTCPIILLIMPTVLTGAFFLKTDKTYATVGTMLFMLSLVICTIMGLLATYAVQNMIEAHPNYLNIKLEKNEHLDWIDFRSSKMSDIHYRVNAWENIPVWTKIYMISGLLVMNVSLFMFTWYSANCFGEFDLQTSSEQFNDDHDEYIELISPLGELALGLFVIAAFIFYTYRKFLQARAGEENEAVISELDTPEAFAAWRASIQEERAEVEVNMKEQHPDDYVRYTMEKEEARAEAKAEAEAADGSIQLKHVVLS